MPRNNFQDNYGEEHEGQIARRPIDQLMYDVENGVMTVAEVRQMLGLPAVENVDLLTTLNEVREKLEQIEDAPVYPGELRGQTGFTTTATHIANSRREEGGGEEVK